MTRKRKTETEKAFERMVEAIAIFLSTVGWQAIVIGNPRIEQKPGAAKFNYEFTLRFTGQKIERPQPAGSDNTTPPGRNAKSPKPGA